MQISNIYLFLQNSIHRVKEDEAIQLEQEIMSEDKVKNGKYLFT
jgi:hypothetical protein